jgi:hypothetical protein
MDVRTHHQIIAVGDTEMRLLDENGEALVTATRARKNWTIVADGVDDATAGDRETATQKMTDHALLKIKGTLDAPGFSTLVPHSVLALG